VITIDLRGTGRPARKPAYWSSVSEVQPLPASQAIWLSKFSGDTVIMPGELLTW